MRSILFVSQQLPWPLTSGGDIRTYWVLAALARRFEVSLVASARSREQSDSGRQALAGLCASLDIVEDRKSNRTTAVAAALSRSLVKRVPAFVEYNFNRNIRDAVAARLAERRFDLIHLNHLDTMPYRELDGGTDFVIDTHNVLHQYFARRAGEERNPLRRAFFSFESRRLARYELAALERARLVLTCSEAERRSLLETRPNLTVEVVPNGVDSESFQPGDDDPFDHDPELLFVGDMGYEPNHRAALELVEKVLPGVQQRVPRATLTLVGRRPSPELVELARDRSDVTVTGFVEDVRPYQRKAKVFVVPIRIGSGTRLKILEAFSMGLPTVSTAIGAEGIDYRDGEDLLIADEPQAIRDAVCRLLDDRELYTRIRQSCRRTACERYDWKSIGRRLLRIYEEF